jgi:hypothetical protein
MCCWRVANVLLTCWWLSGYTRPSSALTCVYDMNPPHMTCILLLIGIRGHHPLWLVAQADHLGVYMTCILLLIWHVSSSSYDMDPPPHLYLSLKQTLLVCICHVSSSSCDMYPPPHMTCIILLIWHVSSSSYILVAQADHLGVCECVANLLLICW